MICSMCGSHYFRFYSEYTKECPKCIDVLPSGSWLDEYDETEIDCLVNGSGRATKTYIDKSDNNDTDSFSS